MDVRGRKAQGSGVLTGDRHGREGLRACRSTSDAASQKPSPAAATDIWSTREEAEGEREGGRRAGPTRPPAAGTGEGRNPSGRPPASPGPREARP